MLPNNFRLYAPLPSPISALTLSKVEGRNDSGGTIDRVVLPRIELIALVLIGNFEWWILEELLSKRI